MVEDVGTIDKDVGYLLTAAFPTLTLEQANRILTETEGPGGGFLDDGSQFGVYSRLNLFAAAREAAAFVSVHGSAVNEEGSSVGAFSERLIGDKNL